MYFPSLAMIDAAAIVLALALVVPVLPYVEKQFPSTRYHALPQSKVGDLKLKHWTQTQAETEIHGSDGRVPVALVGHIPYGEQRHDEDYHIRLVLHHTAKSTIILP
ncbi:hypothetical protein CLCR_00984 [Cladophialophora carrionii]|uniref:Uncharacterized protein n=1 Tax=Cladophialophora carrionii TaxID=86049 RepID=A0A1C1D0Y7_9EURO|nr:hypothetical protein CLCR_00984 [Cladophialophora carrionii]